jgi:hypothetical protein
MKTHKIMRLAAIGIVVGGISASPTAFAKSLREILADMIEAQAAKTLSPDELAKFRQCMQHMKQQPSDEEGYRQCLQQQGLHNKLYKEQSPTPEPPPIPKIGEDVSEKYFNYINTEMLSKCDKELRRLIKYDIRTPGIFWGTNSGQKASLRYTRWSARVAQDGTIRLAGDEAEAQNGLGNWVPINYSCTVDVATKTVRSAVINPGKLP